MDITDLIFIKYNGAEAGRELTLKDLLHSFFFSRKYDITNLLLEDTCYILHREFRLAEENLNCEIRKLIRDRDALP